MTPKQDRGSVMVDRAPSATRARRSRALRLGAAGVAAVALVAAACTPKSTETAGTTPDTSPYANEKVSEDAPTVGGRLVYGVPAETSSFNPVLASWAAYSLIIGRSIFDTLAMYDENGDPKPWLAESITSNPEYTRWTVKLRPGVTYTNGQPVTAQ